MKTLLKIIVGIILLLALIVGGAAFYVTTQFDANQYKSVIIAQVQKTIGRKLTLSGPIALTVFPKIQLLLADASLSNADWAGAQPMAVIKNLKVTLQLMPLLSKQIVAEGIMLDGATLNLAQNGNVNNWTFAPANQTQPAPTAPAGKTAAVAAMALPQIQSIEIKNTVLNYTANGKVTQVSINDAKSALELSKPVMVAIDGKLNQIGFNAAFTGGTLGEIIANADKWPLKGTAQLAGTKVTFDGNIHQPQKFGGADLQITASGNGADMASVTGSPLPFGKFDFATALSMPNAQTANLTGLKFTTGQTNVNGDLKLALNGKPAATGTIHIPILNMADFAGKPAASSAQKQGMNMTSSAHAADGGIIPAIALPVAGLRAADAKIALDIAQISNGAQNMGAFTGNINLTDSILHVTPMTLQYGGNSFTGDITLDGRADTAALTANINSTNLDYGKLLSELKINDRVKGLGALALNFSGSGKDTRQIAASSHGTFKLSSNQGEFDTGILFGSLGNIMNLLGSNYQLPATAKLNCASIEFTGTNGIWNSTQSAVDSDALALTLTGDVDLAREQLNLKANPDIKIAKANGIAPTIKIAGALNKPTLTTDGSSVTQGILAATKLGKFKGSDVLAGFLGGGKTTTATAPTAAAGSCLAAVQKASATTTTTPATATPTTTSAAPASKQQQLNNTINNGLKNLFGK